MSRIQPIFFVVLCMLCVASVLGAGYVNPDYSGKRYRSVLVSVPVADLEFRERLEKSIAKQLRGHTHLAVFSPAKQYSEKEIKKELERLGALKYQVQHYWETMLHGKNISAVEY